MATRRSPDHMHPLGAAADELKTSFGYQVFRTSVPQAPYSHHTMGRRPVNKSIKQKTLDCYRKCKYCSTNRDARGFDKHFAACKVRSAALNENRVVHNRANTSTTPAAILIETCSQQTPPSDPVALRANDRNAAISAPQFSVAEGKCCSLISSHPYYV